MATRTISATREIEGRDSVGLYLDEMAEPVPRLDVDEAGVRARGGLLRDQVAQGGVAVLVDRGVQADVLPAPGHQVDDPVEVHAELDGDLLRLRVAAQASREDRRALATYVIENTGTREDLRKRVAEVFAELQGDAA